MPGTSVTGGLGLTVIRHFKAPKQMVFDAFADPDALAAWWGPKDNPVKVEKLDFKPGGIFHYSMDMMGHLVYGCFNYHRIERPDLLEFSFSFADVNGKPVRAFFAEHWPMEVLNLIQLDEQNGITTLTLTGHPVNASSEEIALYLSNLENMEHGFRGTFEQLNQFLIKKQPL